MTDQAKLWWRAARPWSFTVSLIPPLLGALLAVQETPGLRLNPLHLLLTLLGCVLAHAGANMISDYHDFRNRVDREGTFGSSGSRVLLDGRMAPAVLRNGAWACFGAAAAIGLYFVLILPHGFVLLLPVAVGGLLALFYTAWPIALKYLALGDLAVFVAFGPAMSWGAWFVHTRRFSWLPILYALPIAFLVDAVLHSNNLRDIATDRAVKIHTVAILLGERRAQAMYHALLVSAYLSLLLLVPLAGMPAPALLAFLSLPLAWAAARKVAAKATLPPERFALIDAQTGQLHSAFSLLMLAGLALHLLLR
jgi:1,4-dihydroxy-2-naphthoate polyprenyltransferase